MRQEEKKLTCRLCKFMHYGRCWHPFLFTPQEAFVGGREMAADGWACNLFARKDLTV